MFGGRECASDRIELLLRASTLSFSVAGRLSIGHHHDLIASFIGVVETSDNSLYSKLIDYSTFP